MRRINTSPFTFTIIAALFLASSCATLRIDPPGDGRQTLLVLPVRLTNNTIRNSQHGYYYVYDIVNVDDRAITHRAVIKLPRKGDMLIVDSLPPGNYRVEQFSFNPVGAGDFTYGQNVFPRNYSFTLQAGKVTILSRSLDILMYNKIPGRGGDISSSFDLVTVTAEHRQEILATLESLPNFEAWQLFDQ